ncbi:MAG: acetate/propionate family kinase [Legionellales bacterium]|nr:acetate/propionate family kinase [Legionellales bacterium]
MTDVILTINSGSSSMKFSIFSYQKNLNLIFKGEIESIIKDPYLTLFDHNHTQILKSPIATKGIEASLQTFFKWFDKAPEAMTLKAVGHRIVHGGKDFFHPTLVNDEVMKKIAHLIPLAPFHQPKNLEAIKIIKKMHPDIPQIACFDTSFHKTQKKLATLFAIPRKLMDDGIIRYGFHGISYEYIASVITQHIGDIGNQRVIVAHLGNGASMCAMYQRKSVATSMGLTALDGLMMGSRCGTIDPGVILYLLEEKKLSIEHIRHLLYQESGLLGVSGISNDMRKLQSSLTPHAIEAVDLFCYIAAKELSALCTSIQGCDAIIFTAGIGEQSSIVRKKICEHLQWLGIVLDDHANSQHATIISQKDQSAILVGVIPTNEDNMIAKHTSNQLLNL